jgi:aspartate-semialdehyde dehydrogenase
MERRNVGILGATGMVGQRFIQLLGNHPWFNITWLAASDRSAGKTYGEACKWKLDTPLPKHIAKMVVQPNTPEGCSGELPKIIFAALDADIAKELEPRFAAAGCAVISNSSAFRMAPDVPLVVPEVNADHLDMIAQQSWRRETGGYIVTNPNCSAIGLVLALKPLEERFGIESLFVSTMQAVSGAGYPGVPSLDILGNVVPFIKNEEEKLQEEVGKLLGRFDGGREEILAAWAEFSPLAGMQLPTAPDQPVEFDEAQDRPQPRLDRMRGAGMAATVGRLRPCTVLDWKFVVLSHNTIRGAAGAAVLNAELLARLHKLDPVKKLAAVTA